MGEEVQVYICNNHAYLSVWRNTNSINTMQRCCQSWGITLTLLAPGCTESYLHSRICHVKNVQHPSETDSGSPTENFLFRLPSPDYQCTSHRLLHKQVYSRSNSTSRG
eukprot:jgi/Botrbrau1/22605/Bobra.176_1s0035.1